MKNTAGSLCRAGLVRPYVSVRFETLLSTIQIPTANKLEMAHQASLPAGIAFAQRLTVISPRDLPDSVVSPGATGA